MSFQTSSIHGGDHLHRSSDVTPPINISTTYKYPKDPSKLVKAKDANYDSIFNSGDYYYSRLSHPNSDLIELILDNICHGNCVVYNSGLSAFFALLTHFNPKHILIGQAYHGCHGIADIFSRNNWTQVLELNHENFLYLQPGDLVHLETPVNPEGIHFDISHYAQLAHEKGAILLVDSTFAPPPLQNPFNQGADIIMHSATKYFGGHSDLLAGIIVAKDLDTKKKFVQDRIYLGTNIGNLESSMLVRSLKTLKLRVLTQSDNCVKLVKYLNDNNDKFPNLIKVVHGSLQSDSFISNQVTGHSPVFSVLLKDEETAKTFPSKLKYFYHATSLGGVESLIEWRAISDTTVDERLLRVSVGVEDVEDLIQDFTQALNQ